MGAGWAQLETIGHVAFPRSEREHARAVWQSDRFVSQPPAPGKLPAMEGM